METDITKLPTGRTGASRIEEELLSETVRGDAEESRRLSSILAELVDGFALLRNYDLAATIFGSSRLDAGHRVYRDAELLAGKLAEAGFAVITGGAHGVMQAANKGAKEAGGDSVGFNIRLPDGQTANEYTTERMEFRHFFTRKIMLAFASEVYIFFPGGFGTLDECLELMTLVQTKKIKPIPIILVGREYWQGLLDWFAHTLRDTYRTVGEEDLHIYDLVDSVEEVMEVVKRKVKR
jgi:hypothetical protein